MDCAIRAVPLRRCAAVPNTMLLVLAALLRASPAYGAAAAAAVKLRCTRAFDHHLALGAADASLLYLLQPSRLLLLLLTTCWLPLVHCR
jgi:hypothetical protein